MGELQFDGPVTSFSAPQLTTVDVFVVRQSALSSLDLPALQSVGQLIFGPLPGGTLEGCGGPPIYQPNLTSVKMPSLTQLGYLEVDEPIPVLPQACIDALYAQTGLSPLPSCAPYDMGVEECNCAAGIAGPCL